MSWDVKLTSADDSPLGSIETVKHAILAALPEVRFHIGPSGKAKIAEFEACGIALPEALRLVFEKQPTRVKGDYGSELQGLWMQFDLGPGNDVALVHVAVKGDNEAAESLLRKLAMAQGWSLSNYSPNDER